MRRRLQQKQSKGDMGRQRACTTGFFLSLVLHGRFCACKHVLQCGMRIGGPTRTHGFPRSDPG
ncbi:hypothetical protein EBZ80_24190 [bacterium]|nr:hypothetical protein [bacterium]